MSLRRILKLLGAFFMSQGVNVITQLLVPPIFLHRYPHGVEMYGEWIALTAAVSYLGTLHGGIQSYANNQMTLHYNRGELQEFKIIKSGALRLMLINLLVACGVGVAVLSMPIARWMGLRHISSAAAALTLVLMILQLVMGWFFSFISNSYQVIGELHRGAVWQNVQRLVAMLALAAFLWARVSFPVLALTQVAAMLLFTVSVLVDLHFRAPILFPSLRHGNLRQMIGILKPSAYYMLYSASAFLCWQGPVLLIQKILGPAAVAVFALTRVIFNMSRQILSTLTYAIGQDSIHLIAHRSWMQLHRIYDLSERVVLLLDSVVTVGALLACPFLLSVWLHQRGLYEPGICMLMAMVSAVMGIREHKYNFQYLSNRHEGVAKFCTVVYGGMIVIAALTMKTCGFDAFMVPWLVAELLIAAFVIRQNRKLFPPQFLPSLAPLGRLALLLVASFGAAAWPVWHDGTWPLPQIAAVAAAGVALLLIISYFVFGLREVQAVFERRLRQRFAAR